MGRLSRWRIRRVHAVRLRAVMGVSAVLLLVACANNNYMGISLIPGRTPPELLQLARIAQVGDKQAQFELGYLYETGRNVPQNLKYARRLYELAANESGGTVWVYTPSPGNGAPGRVIPIDRGTRQSGLKEAEIRLKRLE